MEQVLGTPAPGEPGPRGLANALEALPVQPPPTVDSVRTALVSLQPREAQLLRMRLLEGHSLGDCALRYGVDPSATAIHLLRAACALVAALGTPLRPGAW